MTNEEKLKALLASELREDDETFTPYDGALVVRNDSPVLKTLAENVGVFTPRGYAFINQGVEFSLSYWGEYHEAVGAEHYLLIVRSLADCVMLPDEAIKVRDEDCENVVHYLFWDAEDAKRAFSSGIADAVTCIEARG